ncbi:MAG: hypothetical protein QOG79_6658, partial [Mycobacterium sp.]|nr:hypothetical protein [Mycobacterium sp.]
QAFLITGGTGGSECDGEPTAADSPPSMQIVNQALAPSW